MNNLFINADNIEDSKVENNEVSAQVDNLELTDASIAKFGLDVQRGVGELTNEITQSTKNKNAGETGEAITALMKIIRENGKEEDQGGNIITRLFRKGKNSVYNIQAKNQAVDKSIDTISAKLSDSQIELSRDNETLDKMYEQNKQQFQALNELVDIAQAKLNELESSIIPELDNYIKTTKDSEDKINEATIKLNEYQNMQSALSRKLNNLIASRQLALLRAPKLKTLKQTNLTVIDNLQSSINFAIPLWKQQAADAILASRQQQAIEVQKFMTEQTNKMIVSGADNVRKATLEAQKQSNESFVSASKLTQATDILRDTLVQVQSLQKQGDSLRKQEAKDLLQSGEHMKSVALDLMNNDKLIE